MTPIPATLRLVLAFAICGATALPICAAQNASIVTFVPANELLSDITKAPEQDHGIALKSYLNAPGYSATIVRRTRAGSAEVHKSVSDVWYVIDGGGTLVTGGSLVGARETEPGELRGQRVPGGTARRIAKGDLIGIPAGIPHWVSGIDGAQLVYLVVKIKAPARAR
jgi:mannose-6-phosphate isomerase-like protein (cupin superfamily)